MYDGFAMDDDIGVGVWEHGIIVLAGLSGMRYKAVSPLIALDIKSFWEGQVTVFSSIVLVTFDMYKFDIKLWQVVYCLHNFVVNIKVV